MLNGQKLKIFRTEKELSNYPVDPGKFLSDNKSFIKISTLDGYIDILELQLQGRKRMSTKDFLNGFKFE